MEFQGQWSRTKKLAQATHQLFQDLQERLEVASGAGRERGGVVNYAGAREGLEGRENGLRREEEEVWSSCEQRERRWNLTIHLNQLEPNVEKVHHKDLQTLCWLYWDL